MIFINKDTLIEFIRIQLIQKAGLIIKKRVKKDLSSGQKSIHPIFKTFKKAPFSIKHNSSKAFKLNKLLAATRYLKINGTMCCIVLNNVLALCYQSEIKQINNKNLQL